jgi:hypothetical protein
MRSISAIIAEVNAGSDWGMYKELHILEGWISNWWNSLGISGHNVRPEMKLNDDTSWNGKWQGRNLAEGGIS